MKLTISLIIAFSFVSACNQVDHNKKPETKNTLNDTIIKDIPEWYSSSGFTQIMDKKIDTLLKLKPLVNGFDSLQIRIWIECGTRVSSLIVLERERHQWNAVFYSFNIYYDEEFNFEIRNLNSESKTPKSGWESFSENLIKTGIIDLPDHIKFSPKYNLPNDADRVLVEIGTSKTYRLYEYPELGLNNDIAEGPGKLHQALKLIEKEFNYKRPCQDSTGVN
jgi:hypothetical protein